MRIAELLSDLTSLRVCDHTAALALVSARAPSSNATNATGALQRPVSHRDDDDTDLNRARDLTALHYEIKVKGGGSVDRGLVEARRRVREAVQGLERL